MNDKILLLQTLGGSIGLLLSCPIVLWLVFKKVD